jgi:hypothetical protein
VSFQLPTASDRTKVEQRDIPDEGLHIVRFTGWTQPVMSIFQNDRTGEYPMTTKFLFELISDISGGVYEFSFELASKPLNIPDGSMGKKSNIRMYVEAIMGRALADGEAPPDLEDLKGRQCVVDIVHNTKDYDDGAITYANIKTITPHRTGRARVVQPQNDPFPENLSAPDLSAV